MMDRISAGLVAAGGLLLAACATPAPGPTYDEYVSRWVNDAEVNLVGAWGIPDKSHTLEGGGRILEYSAEDASGVLCTTRFTLDPLGRVTKYWYRGTKCKPPQAS